MTRQSTLEARIDEYWDWIAVALFLLITVDLLTSMFATAAVGLAAETNPVMAHLIAGPVTVLVAANLGVVIASVLVFRGITATVRATPPAVRPYYRLWVEVWLGGLVAAGLAVYANNIAVIILGQSLF